jgi:hypothetical protein
MPRQEFAHMAGYKYSTVYMSPGRFLLFLLIISDARNARRVASGAFAKHAKKAEDKEMARRPAGPVTCTDRCCPAAAAATAATAN